MLFIQEVDHGRRTRRAGTAKRRVTPVFSNEKGETSVADAAQAHGLTVAEVETWLERFLLGAENALRSHSKDEEAIKDEQIKQLK